MRPKSFSLLLAFSFVAVAATTLAQTAANPLVNGQPLSSLATSTLRTESDSYWAGEVFTITHELAGLRRNIQGLAGAYEWNPDTLNADEWSTATSALENPPGGEARMTYTQTTRAYVRTPGTLQLPRGIQPVNLVTGASSSGVPGQMTSDTFRIQSGATTVTIRPLPAPPPAGFSGAVGDFTLKASITATEAAVGEAVTWSVELAGSGNWPEIRRLPPRAVSRDFDVVTPAARPDFNPGTLFEGSLTEDILLLPTKEGTYRLGPVKFTYFDPKVGKYQVLTSETFILKVGGGGAGLAPESETADESGLVPGEHVPVPDAPPPVPLDPLDSPLFGLPPFSVSGLDAAVAVPGGLFVIFWLALAARRSQLTDPLYPQRRAFADMKALIDTIESEIGGSPLKVQRHLHAWQKAAARFGGLAIVEPTAAEIAHAIEKRKQGIVGSSWAQLWRESNRVLYGHNAELPVDWTRRARAALSDAAVSPVPVFAIFLRRNLLPFIALLAIARWLPSLGAAEDMPADAYLRGDFAAAEAAWRAAVAEDPTDAHLRYNLALVHAQQDRWTESVAQALSAFVLDPTDPAIRWQFNLSVTRAGIDNPIFAELAAGTGFKSIMRMHSPGGWGIVLALGCTALAFAGGLYLFSVYYAKPRSWRWTSAVLAVLAVGVVVASYVSLREYGQLGDREIAMVSRHTRLCSIPNDADVTQKTSPLPAGSLTKVERVFLGWSRVSFTNGQTGWVRSDALTFLYK